MAAKNKKPLVSILMGSQSDWGVMSHAAQKLDDLSIPWEAQAISAHRATDALMKYLSTTEKRCLLYTSPSPRDGIRDPLWSRGLGDVYKRQAFNRTDAGRRPSGDTRHRKTRRNQRRAVGGVDPRREVGQVP